MLGIVGALVWPVRLNAEQLTVPAVASATAAAGANGSAGQNELAGTPPAAQNAAGGSDGSATQFVATCAGCHTIGGGALRGPDLAGVETWPEPQLKQAIKSMERKVGPLSDPQVDGYLELLKDARVRERLAIASTALTRASQGPVAPLDSLLGGALFFGQAALANGGMACSACHRFRGEGGELGPDLTHFADRIEIDALSPTIARASFPLMRGAYAAHPITEREARDLAAFLKQARAARTPAALARTSPLGLAAGIALFALTLSLILSRPKGVRARLVQRASKR